MALGYPKGGLNPSLNHMEYIPQFSAITDNGTTSRTFYLSDDNLGMYLYSKGTPYPMADRYACR